MANKWMLSTAMLALVAATPAVAQDANEFGECAFEEMTNETFLGLDFNDDSGLTMEEYRNCLNEAGIELDRAGMSAYEGAFTTADADADGILVYAEVETVTASADTGDAPTGTITVTQPAAEVVVNQPAPDVNVATQEPEVAVSTPKPEVSVETQEPEVAVSQAEPTVSVEQPQPVVRVDQPAPEVNVSQPQAEVAVEAGQPAVSVETAEPEVAVATPEPEVEVTQPDLDVNVEQENAEVAVRQQQADVAVATTNEVETDTDMAIASSSAEMAATDMAAAEVKSYQIRIDDMIGADLYNSNGEEIGEIDEIVLDPASNKPVVLVSTGGFLGLGDREVMFPYDDITFADDRAMLSSSLTEDDLKAMPDVDEDEFTELPETMIIR